jgi:membrane associated rhomboid family serine protease
MDEFGEYNASGTLVRTRPSWGIALMMFICGPFYRLIWAERANSDILEFSRARGNSTIPATLMAISFAGWIMLSFALPWGYAAINEANGGSPVSDTWRLVLAGGGVLLLLPGVWGVLKTRSRIANARELAGLPRNTRWTGRWLFLLLLFEIVAAPVWIFALQHSLNELWSQYPPLLDEDLHGVLAPPSKRDAAVKLRPALHVKRLERVAEQLGSPRRVPWIVIGFSVLCVAVWIWQVTVHGFIPTEHEIEKVGGYRRHIDGQGWRFWFANLLHGSVAHIVGNLAVFAVVGTMLERAVGHARLIVLLIVGAAGASIGTYIANYDEVAVGASGVVFAAVGMAAAVDPRARRGVGKMGYLFGVLGLGFSTFAPGIASGAHVAGMLSGIALGLVVLTVWRAPKETLADHEARTAVVDRNAPLAPNRQLSLEERLEHLKKCRDEGLLSDEDVAGLARALASGSTA